jgi:hypothetical protein
MDMNSVQLKPHDSFCTVSRGLAVIALTIASSVSAQTIPGCPTVSVQTSVSNSVSNTSLCTIAAALQTTNTGIITNTSTGTLNNSNQINTYGQLTNAAGGIINNNYAITTEFGGTLTNQGTINNAKDLVTFGVTTNAGTIQNNGNVWAWGGTFNNTGTFNNNYNTGATLTASGGGQINNSGTITNVATINAQSAGLITNASTGIITNGLLTLVSNGGTFTNNGSFTNYPGGTVTNNGTLNNAGAFNNNSGGTVTNNAALTNTGQLSNKGTFNNNATGTLTNQGQLSNSGTFASNGAVVNTGQFTNTGFVQINSADSVSGSGTYVQQTGGATIVAGNTWSQNLTDIQSGPFIGTNLIVNGSVINQGAIQGNGSGIVFTGTVSGKGSYLGTIQFDGTFKPGNSPAAITGEHFIFGSSSELDIELGGMAAGTQYDVLYAQHIDLAGTLSLSLIDLGNGVFNPHAGDFFDILQAWDITGDFTAFNLAQLDTGLYWAHSIIDFGYGDVFRLTVAGSTNGGGNVPEPGSLMLALLALLILAWHARSQQSMLRNR